MRLTSHNMWFLGITPGFLKSGPLASYFESESGLFCAVLYLFIAIYIAFRGRNNISDTQILGGDKTGTLSIS